MISFGLTSIIKEVARWQEKPDVRWIDVRLTTLTSHQTNKCIWQWIEKLGVTLGYKMIINNTTRTENLNKTIKESNAEKKRKPKKGTFVE